ncbi:hypothetical protein K432DRAFT_406358 [Lepidopterella palustris CBS 459.81]|uniref:Chitin synthase activator n=1 Tax=Lepidopterella palustris CBS 459.81 TaxID=1314670 RepID=A0A8E2E763_9PEZI|nr:hypothetical protein K432DRAFT_406358 [Lepidopterella palustris CBS 459.81]
MSYQQGQPQLGATFIPGGFDDYYMPAPSPEVISPAPQRIMPEVPENMQENIAHLELEANQPRNSIAAPPSTSQFYNQDSMNNFPPRSSSYQHEQPQGGTQGGEGNWPARHTSISSAYKQPPSVPVQPVQPQPSQSHDYNQFASNADLPNFSPFPRLQNRPRNVPPSDDEKEAVLENARIPVLNSNDPEMQLAWAQDALAYVDAAMLHDQRLSETQPARPVTPQVEHQLRIDAMNIVSFLADQHHPKAEFMKGMWLEFGKFGLRIDKKEAFRCYSRAAEKGYARAEYRMGMQFEQSNDPIKALVHYKRGSEAGDSASNYRLGMMTLLGQHGQPQDFAKGIQLIKLAALTADENAPQGAYVLGMLQARELPQINVPEIYLPYDEKIARQNIEKAAYLGFAKAQLKMGAAYELCTLGCDFNPAFSMHYNALASRQGEAEADMAISKWFLCGYEGEFAKNEELAYRYALQAAQQGLATAEFAMGYFNEIGMHVPTNLEKATEWYEKAAKAGNKDAAARLDGIAKSRTLSKKDHENIAIQKIKSQYGSMRGQRPARLKAAAPALPAIVDDSPSDYGSDASISSPVETRLPNRNASSTPYPLSDKPPSLGPVGPVGALGAAAPYERAATVTPYPVGDGPPRVTGRPGLAGGFAPELRSPSAAPRDSRPVSAFNINPNIYPQDNGGPPGGRMPPPGQGNMGALPLRPYTSMDGMGQGRGRAPGGPRISSGGLPPGPGAYRQPGGPSVERPEPYGTPRPSDKPQPPRPDGGYSAPPDGRNRLQKGGNPNLSKPQPTLPDIGYIAPLETKQPPKPSVSHSQSFSDGRPSIVQPTQERPSSARPQERPQERPATATGARPGSRPNSRPGSSGRPSQHDPMPKPQKAERPQQQEPPKPSKSAPKPSPAAAHPPGKGPKTFDEMGISQAPKEDECIVM